MAASFTILLKKNLILEKRTWTWTLFEILIIIVFYTVIVINPVVKSKNYMLELDEAQRTLFYENRTSLYDLSAFLRLKNIQKNRLHYGLIYGPSTPFTKRIVEAVRLSFHLRGDLFAVDNEPSMINNFNEHTFLAGIYFHNLTAELDVVPEKLSVTISFPSEFRTSNHPVVFDRLWLTRCTGVLDDLDTDRLTHVDLYLREGFLQIQHRLFMEWLRMLRLSSAHQKSNGEHEDGRTLGGIFPSISIKSLRHHTDHEPCHTESTSNIIWFLYYFTFFVPFLRLIRKFAREREENIPAHHWIYGYENGHHWVAHFLISFLHFLQLALIAMAFVTIQWTSVEKYHIFRHVNPLVLLLFLTLYIVMLIIYAMVVSTIFVNTANCMLFGAAMWLGSYGLFSPIVDSTEEFTIPVAISLILFFNNFFPYGMRLMKNINTISDYRQIWLLIYTDIGNIFFLLFMLSVADFFRPGRYIRRLYFNYLCIPYCCFCLCNATNRRRRETSMPSLDRPTVSGYNFEYGPLSGQDVLYMNNVSTYVDRIRNKMQLKKLTVKFFKNEISVILGPHSTGKTRLITMLAGWRKPDAGYIYFDGDYDIYKNWLFYRNMVDVSMPNNPLYDLLAVRETLSYFCELKLRKGQTVDSEVNKWLAVLKPFVSNADRSMVQDLTFSQKRLLSLCCTLAGDRPIILLDEPTIHMTFAEQRYYWDILRKEKDNRAIIMSTFSIDEADAVGDRIGLLSEGSLLAWGTPFFLKTRFGIGFDLIILKDPNISSLPITELINSIIPNILPGNEIGNQLIYKLPSDKKDLFQRMLIHLEKHSKEFGISHIQMSGSQLSEVYMTLGIQESSDSTLPELQKCADNFKSNKGYSSHNVKNQQMHAMLYKKMIHQAPNIIPIIMVFVVFLLILLINEMTKRIPVPSTVNRGIQLGLPMNASNRAILDEFHNCSFVEISETLSAQSETKLNNKPKYFHFKHFECGKRSYRKDVLNEVEIYDKLGAVELLEGGKQMVLWINERIFHTASLSLNLAHNLILKNLYPDKPQILTTIVNKPMIIPLHVKINLIDNQIAHLRMPLTMGIIMPITMSCFIVSLVEERQSHLLALQRLAGLRMGIYWLVGILWDYGTFFAFSIFYFVVMISSTIEGFGPMAKVLTLLLLNVHGISSLCFIYLMSLFMANSRYRAFLISIVVQLIIGLCGYVFYWDIVENSRYFYYLLSLSPTFSLLDGISNVYTENKEHEYCRDRCQAIMGCNEENMCTLIQQCCFDKFFKWSPPGILPSLAFMTLSGVLSSIAYFFIILYRTEKMHSSNPRIKQMGTVCFPLDDEDVVKEKLRIANMNMGDCKKHQLLVDQMEHQIPRHSKRLNTISFALDRHTCLAVYGARHAGKSHVIQQLIGERDLRFGEMYICGRDCKYEMEEAYQCVGYCPQDRGLCNAFTPRQLFSLLFMIRGVPTLLASEKLKEISRLLNLRLHMSKRICFLPENVKRKLNIGISLIVCNKVLILDEPTRGMSAVDRRLICNVLKQAKVNGNTVIFSTSDSLECEKLADQMIAVDNGEMLAIGSPQYLRNKYTKGFYLEVKILPDGNSLEETEQILDRDIENMLAYVHFLHDDSKLINRHGNILKYYIPVENIRYSYLFGSLEKNQCRLNIAEYTIGQASILTVLQNTLATRLLREPYRKKRKIVIETVDELEPSNNSDNQDPENPLKNTQEPPEDLETESSQHQTEH